MNKIIAIWPYGHNRYFQELISWFDIKAKKDRLGYFYCENYNEVQYLCNLLYHLSDTFHLGGDTFDRTESIKFPYKIHYLSPWKIPKSHLSYNDCCDLVAQKLNKKNYEIYSVFWSGGLDSTCMLVALLMNLDFLQERLQIYYSQESIDENPSMYELICKLKLKKIKMNYDFDFEKIEGHVITGDPGDLINVYFSHTEYSSGKFKKPWKDELLKKSVELNLINWAENFLQKSGKIINSIAEAKHWLNLISRKQAIELHPLHYSSKINLNNYTAFYSDQLFEDWSYFNVEQFCNISDPNKIKSYQKKYINQYHNDDHYSNTKGKFLSTFLFSASNRQNIFNNMYYFIDQNGVKVTTKSLPYVSKEEFCNKYSNFYNDIFL